MKGQRTGRLTPRVGEEAQKPRSSRSLVTKEEVCDLAGEGDLEKEESEADDFFAQEEEPEVEEVDDYEPSRSRPRSWRGCSPT
jgi:hypothetical protein